MARNPQVFTFRLSAKQLPRGLVEAVRSALDRAAGLPKFNAIYAGLPPCRTVDFPRTILDALQIKVTFAGMNPDSIPATGPLLVVANHPFGFVEGMALDALLLARREDATFLGMYVFAEIPELRERWILVDPERSRRKRHLNSEGVRKGCEWLARGGTLAVFPAGRVARFSWRRMRVAEQRWSARIAAIARETEARILPVYFHGHNNWFYQLVGMLHPRLQHLLFFREFTNQRGRTFRAAIGAIIEPAELARFKNDGDAIQFLRQETEKLAQLG